MKAAVLESWPSAPVEQREWISTGRPRVAAMSMALLFSASPPAYGAKL